MASLPDIYVTEMDKFRLQSLIEFEEGMAIAELGHEIERAILIDPLEVAEDVVTMNSKVLLRLDNERAEVDLVYPQNADDRSGKLSVLSEIGTAILGYQEGDAIDWVVRDRTREIRIEKLIYQPESRGDLHL